MIFSPGVKPPNQPRNGKGRNQGRQNGPIEGKRVFWQSRRRRRTRSFDEPDQPQRGEHNNQQPQAVVQHAQKFSLIEWSTR